MGKMEREEIDFTCYEAYFGSHSKMIFMFYPNGVWDEDKLARCEALAKYPTSKYKWVFID